MSPFALGTMTFDASRWGTQPRIDALLLGASRPEQVTENVAALELDLSAEQRATLDAASTLEPAFPYLGFNRKVKRSIFGGTEVTGWAGSVAL